MELEVGQGKEIGLAKIQVDEVEPQHTPKTQVNESKLVIQKKNLTFSEKRKKLAEDKKNKKAKKQYLKGFNVSEAENKLLKHYQKGQYSEAEMLAVFITKQFPEHQFSWKILGTIYGETGRLSEALVAGKKAVHLMPKDAEALNNLGTTLNILGKTEEAEATLGQSIALQPDSADAHNNMGNALTDKGDLGAAIDSYKRALQIKPDFADAYYNMGVALKDNEDPDGAIDSYQKALKIRPDYAEAYNNLGHTLSEEGKLNSAIDNLKQAIKIKPDFADAFHNLSYPYFLRGSVEKGFNFYESRLRQTKPTVAPARSNLVWDGEKSLSGKHFVIYEEQGLGDMIQFCRYLPLLEQKGANITFKVKSNLHALLQTMDSNSRFVTSFPEENKIDFEAPLMSVPHLLGTSLETIPATNPYLFADQEKIQTWGERVSTDRFKVGICWQGSTVKAAVGRSFPLSLFEGISRIPNVELISLHKGEGEAQITGIDFDLTTLGHDFDAGQDAFFDTAAVMMNCNLIITCDTSIAHLAGAIGRPTWLALKQTPHWVWMLDRPDSPWYPTITLYRQKSRGDWVDVFDTIERDLRSLLQQKKEVK
jgi:tetratricopeptide (TPR) repeat protein